MITKQLEVTAMYHDRRGWYLWWKLVARKF